VYYSLFFSLEIPLFIHLFHVDRCVNILKIKCWLSVIKDLVAYTMTTFPNPTSFVMPNPDPQGSVPDDFRHAQQAQMVSQNFGIPMQGSNPGMWANILPAAIQIHEHKKMNEVAQKYQDKYVQNFKDRYGFKDGDLDTLKDEFKEITDHITGLIPDEDLKAMYKKYVQSYPHMYLSMIPPEALQAKLRGEVAEMSKCVTSLVKSLSKLQMAAGVPPIVSLMFESMPDPLTAITDPMYSTYNDAIIQSGQTDSTTGQPILASALLLSKPGEALDIFENNLPSGISSDEIKALRNVISNMGSSSGCQTYGDEWNHMGPEPAMNPAMCLGEDDKMQPGNPRHPHGRTAVYKAQRTQDGGAQWVMKGQVPNPTADAEHMLTQANLYNSRQHHPQAHYAPFSPMPAGMPMRKKSGRKSKTSTKKKGGRKSSK